jgi:hypothetical protein
VQYHKYEAHTDTVYRIYEQDVEPAREACLASRNDESISKAGIKKDWWHVAHYSAVDVMEMMKRFKVNPMTHPDEALKIAKVHFPWCLTVKKSALERSPPKLIIAK